MIAEQKTHRLVRSHDFDEAQFGIDQEDIGFVIDLLRNQIYSNKILAVIREYTTNAVDAHNDVGKEGTPISVGLPTRFNPHFTVRDFGDGLSHDDVCNIYVRYCKSTKRQSNAFTGQLGIGCKSGFAYGDSFTVTSYHNGIKSTYVAQIDETSQGKIIKMDESKSKEPSGIEIKIAVAEDDVHTFQKEALDLFKYFKIKPKLTGNDQPIKDFNKTLEGDDWYIVESEKSYGWQYRSNRAIAIMGNIGYPIDANVVKNLTEHQQSILQHGELHIQFDIGDLSIAPSREALEYTRKTQAKIKEKAQSVIKDLQKVASEKLKNSGDLWEAKNNYAKIHNAFDYSLRDILKDCFIYKGVKVEDSRFEVPNSLHDWCNPHVKIRRYEINDTNGKLKPSKERHIYCQDNALIVESDSPSNSGLTARMRHLFNEDSDLKYVYFVDIDTQKNRKTFRDHNNWQLLDKDRVKKLSDIPKAKVNKVSGTTQGVTRSHIGAFIFDHVNSATGSNSSDYWQDADNIDPKKDSGIYVPLWRYDFTEKPDNTSEVVLFNAEIKNALEFINKNRKTPVKVYGFRFRDESKLDKSKWTRFDEYFKSFVQKHFKGQKGKDALQAISNIYELGKYENKIDEIEGTHLGRYLAKKLDEKHRIVKLFNFKNIRSELQTKYDKYLSFWTNFLKTEDKQKIFDVKLPKSDYNIITYRKRITDLYPMIPHVSSYSYGHDDQLGKDVVNYIKMVDEYNKQNNIFLQAQNKKSA